MFQRWRRKVADLELWELLRRRGTRALASHNPGALEFAVERCTACKRVHECAADLATADGDARREKYCPNSMYLRHLDAMLRHAPKRSLTGSD